MKTGSQSLNEMADFQRKIHASQVDVTRHREMMAAAYMKATNIPPEECELVVETLPDKMVYRFQRRRTPPEPCKHDWYFSYKRDGSHVKICRKCGVQYERFRASSLT